MVTSSVRDHILVKDVQLPHYPRIESRLRKDVDEDVAPADLNIADTRT
jgi:hypothetical protein